MQERRKRKNNAVGENEGSSKRTSTFRSSNISGIFDTAIDRDQLGCIIFADLIRKDKPIHSSNSGIHNFNNFMKAPQGRFYHEKDPVIVVCSIPFAQRFSRNAEAMSE